MKLRVIELRGEVEKIEGLTDNKATDKFIEQYKGVIAEGFILDDYEVEDEDEHYFYIRAVWTLDE